MYAVVIIDSTDETTNPAVYLFDTEAQHDAFYDKMCEENDETEMLVYSGDVFKK